MQAAQAAPLPPRLRRGQPTCAVVPVGPTTGISSVMVLDVRPLIDCVMLLWLTGGSTRTGLPSRLRTRPLFSITRAARSCVGPGVADAVCCTARGGHDGTQPGRKHSRSCVHGAAATLVAYMPSSDPIPVRPGRRPPPAHPPPALQPAAAARPWRPQRSAACHPQRGPAGRPPGRRQSPGPLKHKGWWWWGVEWGGAGHRGNREN